MSLDSAFSGSIPAIYEDCLVPALFLPFARELADRIARIEARDLLELAAGTGAVSREIAARMRPGQRLTATDLNPEMIAIAAQHCQDNAITFRAADAQNLPFADHSFDLAAAQFGVMFFPDRVRAHAEVRRVLRPQGWYLFNVWNRLEDNPGSQIVHEAVRDVIGTEAPDFIARVPFGYHDRTLIEADLEKAGFADRTVEEVSFVQPPEVLPGLVLGMCRGSPLAAALADFNDEARSAIEVEAIRRLRERAGREPVRMSALVVTARRD